MIKIISYLISRDDSASGTGYMHTNQPHLEI